MKLTTKQVTARLHNLSKQWPDHLWLFAAAGKLTLMKKTEAGRRGMDNGNVDPTLAIDAFSGIECDGGDW